MKSSVWIFNKRKSIMVSICLFYLLYNLWWFPVPSTQQKHSLFAGTPTIIDIGDGSMERLFGWIHRKPINIVIYYTRWSGDCSAAVKEISYTSKLLTNSMISFIAIDCWKGSCKKNFNAFHFPRIFLYHTSLDPIEYLYDINSTKFVDFIANAVQPMSYIGNKEQLNNFMNVNHNKVIAYMDYKFLINGKRYRTFLNAAISLVNRLNRPTIGLIISKDLAAEINIIYNGQFCSYTFYAERNCFSMVSEYTVSNIVSWISTHSKQLVTELTPNASDSNFYVNQLKDGPVAILAYSDKKVVKKFQSLALKYYQCSCSISKSIVTKKRQCPLFYKSGRTCTSSWHYGNLCVYCSYCEKQCLCRTHTYHKHLPINCISFKHKGYYFQNSFSVCCFPVPNFINYDLNDKSKQLSFEFNNTLRLLNNRQSTFNNYLYVYNKNLRNEANIGKNKPESQKIKCGKSAPCCNLKDTIPLATTITGLACNTNRSLSFFSIEFDRYKYLLGNAGVLESPSLLISNVKAEESYVSQNVSYKYTVTFVLNFTNYNLEQKFTSSPVSKKAKGPKDQKIVHLFSETFHDFIMQAKNVFVMFFAKWCGTCKTVHLQYLKLVHSYKKHDVVFARIDADKNPLPFHFTASLYPSFILFPHDRKDDSIPFDDRNSFTTSNFVKFLDKYLD